MSMSFRTNAKLNLYLRVGERRADGFHELETVFHSVSLADELFFERLDSPDIEVSVVGADIAAGDNLVGRAARLLQERTGSIAGAAIEVRKNIPIGGGLAGGSGNAAGTLLALNELWGLELTEVELTAHALELGSDVPYCLRGGTCLAQGRGEVLTPLVEPAPMWFVLGISNEPLSTGEVYGAHELRTEAPSRNELTAALESADLDAVAAALHNDLEGAAMRLRPKLLEKKEALVEAGAIGALVSGSGPTIFGLCRDEDHARKVSVSVATTFDLVEVSSSRPAIVERQP